MWLECQENMEERRELLGVGISKVLEEEPCREWQCSGCERANPHSLSSK